MIIAARARFVVASCLVAAAVGACSDSDVSQGATVKPGEADGGVVPSPGVLRDAAVEGGTDGGGDPPLDTVSIADGPCVAPGGTVKVVYPRPADLGFLGLEKLGARWVASARDDRGFVLLDADGANASAQPPTSSLDARARAASNGVVTFGIVGEGLAFRRFDDQGNAVGAPLVATTEAAARNPNLAPRDDGSALLVWGTPFDVYVRSVDAQGVLGVRPFEVDDSSPKSRFRSAVLADGPRYAVAWSVREDLTARFRTRLALVDPSALTARATTLNTTTSPQEVVGIVRSSTGFRVLVDTPPPGPGMVLIETDQTGKVVGPGHVIAGSLQALGLAAQGDELGVVALRADKRVAFRPLTSKLEAAGPWVCLDAPATSNPDFSGAIAPDGAGYAVLYRAADDGQSLRRFDRLGTGPL